MVMNFIAPKLSVENVVGQGLGKFTQKEVSNDIHYGSIDKNTVPSSSKVNLSTCSGIVLQQSNLVDSTVTLHLHLVVRNKRWNSLQVGARGRKNDENVSYKV